MAGTHLLPLIPLRLAFLAPRCCLRRFILSYGSLGRFLSSVAEVVVADSVFSSGFLRSVWLGYRIWLPSERILHNGGGR